MKIELDSELIKKAVDTYGVESQINMVFEECAELINALEKYRRGRVDAAAVITEIADVEIMCAQLEYIFGGDSKIVEAERFRKMDRLRGKLSQNK